MGNIQHWKEAFYNHPTKALHHLLLNKTIENKENTPIYLHNFRSNFRSLCLAFKVSFLLITAHSGFTDMTIIMFLRRNLFRSFMQKEI